MSEGAGTLLEEDGGRPVHAVGVSPAPGQTDAVTLTEQVSALLHEAGETHHVVFRITDGDDPDWASWYSDWLLQHSELPTLLGGAPVRSHLTHALVQLDRDYAAASPTQPWEDWYAERLVTHLAHS